MSLADELLADLEDEAVAMEEPAIKEEPEEIEDIAMVIDAKQASVHSIAKLNESEQLKRIMSQIKDYSQREKPEAVVGPVEAAPEYRLIVEANSITVEIDNEINVIHKYTKDNYVTRFPELDSLVPAPLEYMRTVKELGNDILEKSKNNEALQRFVIPATIMVVSVTASTTQGSMLSEEQLSRVFEACDMAIALNDKKQQILEFVQSRMTFIAPNLTAIVGASTAAKLMGTAGGLTNLAKMPACNILLLGAQKKTLAGFSQTSTQPHTGYVFYCELAHNTPPHLRRKAARLLAGKCALAARVDSCHESTDGHIGTGLRTEIEARLEKLQEPPPVKAVKALPAPIDAPRKKRGGRRARKNKERLGMTDMRKAARRMNFGEIEEDAYQEDLGFSLGNLGKKNSGRLRGPVVDSKTKARISKTLQQKLTKQQQWGGSTTVRKQIAGTASVAFTPMQGLEIVNPQAADKKAHAANEKYFSSTAGFMSVKPR